MRNSTIAFLGFLIGCGSVTGGEAPGDGGSEHRQDVGLMGDGKADAGGTATDAGDAQGGGDALEVDGGDGRDGNSAGICVPPGAQPFFCPVRPCSGKPGCALCATANVSGACDPGGPASAGIGGCYAPSDAGGAFCIATSCSDCP